MYLHIFLYILSFIPLMVKQSIKFVNFLNVKILKACLILLALSWLRGTNDVHYEMEDMRAEFEEMKSVPKVIFLLVKFLQKLNTNYLLFTIKLKYLFKYFLGDFKRNVEQYDTP